MCRPSTTRCTSLSSLLFILIFIKSHILFLHILFVLHILLFYCFALFFILLHILLFISFFTYIYIYIYIYICSCVVLLLYIYIYFFFNSLHCPLSGPDLTYISLLIIPCIIYHVTNKETLTLTLKCNISQISLQFPLHFTYLKLQEAQRKMKATAVGWVHWHHCLSGLLIPCWLILFQ